MISFSRFSIGVIVLTMIIGIALGAGNAVVTAQDQPEAVVCDPALLTLLFIAERDYDFESQRVDAGIIDKGPYTGMFDQMMAQQAMQAEQDEMQATPETATDDDMDATPEGDTMPQATPGDQFTALPSGTVEGEHPDCAMLRLELVNFFFDEFSADPMGTMDHMDDADDVDEMDDDDENGNDVNGDDMNGDGMGDDGMDENMATPTPSG